MLFATHNGQQTLPRVLAAYEGLRSPAPGWHLVVVDNASSDETAAILAAYRDRLPLTVLFAPERGKNRALNLALSHGLHGTLTVLTDDDIVPEPSWLQALQNAADRQPGMDIFGGAIVASWPGECPGWIQRCVPLGATYGLTGVGKREGEVPPSEVWGGNMAVRGCVFDRGFRFAEHVGPSAGQYMMGSEVEFTSRLAAAGHRCWFVPDAVGAHIIRPMQLERSWIVQRAYRLGRHMFHQEREVVASHPAWRGMPRWRLRRLVTERIAQVVSRLRRDADASFRADWEVSFLQGYLAEARSAAQHQPRT